MGVFHDLLMVQMGTKLHNASYTKGVLQKCMSTFEGQHPTFSFNKSLDTHKCKTLMSVILTIIYFFH